MITKEIKDKFNKALDIVYKEAWDFRYVDLREVVWHYNDFIKLCKAYDYANKVALIYGEELSFDEYENYIGCTHNAESTFSIIYDEFLTKFNKGGNNTYHTVEENYMTAIKFAELLKLVYNVDLITYYKVTSKEKAIKRYQEMISESNSPKVEYNFEIPFSPIFEPTKEYCL